MITYTFFRIKRCGCGEVPLPNIFEQKKEPRETVHRFEGNLSVRDSELVLIITAFQNLAIFRVGLKNHAKVKLVEISKFFFRYNVMKSGSIR